MLKVLWVILRGSERKGYRVTNSDHHYLDELAKALASGTVSRRQALKLIGASLAGASLALIPGIASASPPPHANAGGRFGSSAPPEHAHDHTGSGVGGRFGKGGPLPGSGTCSGAQCSSDSECGEGCQCCYNEAGGFFSCC